MSERPLYDHNSKSEHVFVGVDSESPRSNFYPGELDQKRSNGCDLFQAFVVSSIVILFILVIILFSTYEPKGSNNNNNNALQSSDTTSSGSTVYISTASIPFASRVSSASSSSSSSSVNITSNTAVSFNANGALQRGGGTSIYKNIFTLEAGCSQYLQMDAILNNTYVFSAANSSGTLFQIVQIGGSSKDSALDIGLNNNKATLLNSQYTSEYSFYEIVGLSITEGLMIGLTQDFSPSKNVSYLVAFQVNRNLKYKIQLGAGILYTTDQYSINPQVARLSENSFVMSYYSDPSPDVNTRVGVINRDTLEITLSKPVVFADNTGYGLTATVVGLSSTMYLLTYYNSQNGGGSKLQTKIGTVKIIENPITSISLTVTNSSIVSETSKLIYYLSATRIDDFTAVVCYTDVNTGQGLTAQIISVTNQYALSRGVKYNYTDDFDDGYLPHQVLYGSTWIITMGRSQTNTVQGYLDFAVQSYTADGRFVVVYTDMTNDAGLTVIMGEITSSNNIRRVTPNMVVNRPKDLIVNQAYQWSAVGVGRNESYNGQMAIVYAISSDSCTENIQASVSVLETKPQHVGIVASDKSQVVISGLAPLATSSSSTLSSGSTDVNGNIQSLKPFRYYYTDTMGRLFTTNEDNNNVGNSPTGSLGTSYMGRSLPTLFSPDSTQNADTFISPRFQEYIEIQEPGKKQRSDQGVIVTMDSQVGVAVGTSSLFMIPNFNGGSSKGA